MTMKEKESARHQETGCSATQKSEVENSQVSLRHHKRKFLTRRVLVVDGGFTTILTGKKQVPTDYDSITQSEKTQCQVHLSSENVQGNWLDDTPPRQHTNSQVKTPRQHNNLELCNVDHVS